MILSLPGPDLGRFVDKQIATFFPDGNTDEVPQARVDDALDRLATSFVVVAHRTFCRDNEPVFNHLHSDQYAMFLYLLANSLYRADGPRRLCEKLFCLNKALYGIDAFYEVELPRVFLFCHAGGTVLGRATYSDYFLVYQHCTVGSARAEKDGARGVFPVLGRHASLYAGASVLGSSTVGDNCKIAAHSVLQDRNLDPNTVYRGTPQSFETAERLLPDEIWKKTSD